MGPAYQLNSYGSLDPQQAVSKLILRFSNPAGSCLEADPLHRFSNPASSKYWPEGHLQTQMLDAPDNVANVASQAMLAVAWMICTSIQEPTGGQLTKNAKAANLDIFDGS